jgi:hypothetical protein
MAQQAISDVDPTAGFGRCARRAFEAAQGFRCVAGFDVYMPLRIHTFLAPSQARLDVHGALCADSTLSQQTRCKRTMTLCAIVRLWSQTIQERCQPVKLIDLLNLLTLRTMLLPVLLLAFAAAVSNLVAARAFFQPSAVLGLCGATGTTGILRSLHFRRHAGRVSRISVTVIAKTLSLGPLVSQTESLHHPACSIDDTLSLCRLSLSVRSQLPQSPSALS